MRNWGVINNWLLPYWSRRYLPAPPPPPPPPRTDFTHCEKRVGTYSSSSLMDQQQAFQRGRKEKEMRWQGESERGGGGGSTGRKMRRRSDGS